MKQIIRLWIALGVAGFLVLAGSWFCLYRIYPYSGASFDRAVWLSAKVEATSSSRFPRQGMVGDLIREHLKEGMSREDVRQLLGRPDGDTEGRGSPGMDYYALAIAGPARSDLEKLRIRYDRRGRLISASVGFY